ncbi:putative nuclease HARBI1 [Argopecten irradians]|uniref:putative nuclease HARBI1 n=1 Tax=Argopecten irradians TaxID=31199 RepID=UPI00371A79D6
MTTYTKNRFPNYFVRPEIHCQRASSIAGAIDVCKCLYQLGERVIQWPSPEKQQQTAQQVQQVCTLPGVIGFLDGTHIRLSTALGGEKDYFNRKGFPSMQLQSVVDEQMAFINVYTEWPGCVHDARVLRNSTLFHKAEAGELILQNHHIFADNAYPLKNWLITPFKNLGNLTRPQIRFNKRLSSVRQTVERAFAHLKGRFRKLKDIPLHNQEDICTLIYACCVLHNLCIRHNDDVDAYIDGEEEEDPNQFVNVYQNGHVGVVRRLQLMNQN